MFLYFYLWDFLVIEPAPLQVSVAKNLMIKSLRETHFWLRLCQRAIGLLGSLGIHGTQVLVVPTYHLSPSSSLEKQTALFRMIYGD